MRAERHLWVWCSRKCPTREPDFGYTRGGAGNFHGQDMEAVRDEALTVACRRPRCKARPLPRLIGSACTPGARFRVSSLRLGGL